MRSDVSWCVSEHVWVISHSIVFLLNCRWSWCNLTLALSPGVVYKHRGCITLCSDVSVSVLPATCTNQQAQLITSMFASLTRFWCYFLMCLCFCTAAVRTVDTTSPSSRATASGCCLTTTSSRWDHLLCFVSNQSFVFPFAGNQMSVLNIQRRTALISLYAVSRSYRKEWGLIAERRSSLKRK